MKIDVESLYNRKRVNRWERVSVGDIIERVTYSFPDKEALVSWRGAFAYNENERLTYRELDQKANQFANGLISKGLERAARIFFYCDNSAEAFIAKLGAVKAGMVVTPVNTRVAEDVVEHIINLTEPDFFISDSEHWKNIHPLFEKKNIRLDVTIPIGGKVSDGSQEFKDFIENESISSPEVEIHGDDIWEILFTSGTTSMPKGVMISHHSSYFAAYTYTLSVSRNLKYEGDLKTFSFLPMIYHSGDQNAPMAAWLSGGTFLLGRKYHIPDMAEAITKESLTMIVQGSPTYIKNLVEVHQENPKKYDYSTVTTVVYGFAPLDPKIHHQLKEIIGQEVAIFELFSQTESLAGFRFWHDEYLDSYLEHAPLRNYVGVPSPILEAKVIDDDGKQVVEAGDFGEVVYRSPSMLSGYYKNEKATAEAFDGGWFHSGDILELDENGLGIMIDRKKDVIKSGGENVSSIRVEAALRQHDSISDAAVVGLPDIKWDESVTGFVVLKEGHNVSENEIIDFARERLGGFETPKKIIFLDELPTSVAGKVRKYKLRTDYSNNSQT